MYDVFRLLNVRCSVFVVCVVVRWLMMCVGGRCVLFLVRCELLVDCSTLCDWVCRGVMSDGV